MVQFKDVILGKCKAPNDRVTTAQRCIRAGGKHNDLEEVGRSLRHHTFFEMLGNFSFGAYFKREAIAMAWEFLTKELAIPPDRLRVTTLEGDNEAADIWRKDWDVISFPTSAKDNFWTMGEVEGNPCGPCSEIYFYRGSDPGSLVSRSVAPPDDPLSTEIWNLVFMQYSHGKEAGSLHPLKTKCVDTGMGLERLAMVLQDKPSTYDIDSFSVLIQAAQDILNREWQKQSSSSLLQPLPLIYREGDVDDFASISARILADHIRSATIIIADGIRPSKTGRSYVLRRLIRRALSHVYLLLPPIPSSIHQPPSLTCRRVLSSLFDEMLKNLDPHHFSDLFSHQRHISQIFEQEEANFTATLSSSRKYLDQSIQEFVRSRSSSSLEFPASKAFELYHVFGLPLEITQYLIESKGFFLDSQKIEELLEIEQQRSRKASSFSAQLNASLLTLPLTPELRNITSVFTGYHSLHERDSQLLSFLPIDNVTATDGTRKQTNHMAFAVISPCPFYARGGGQVGDKGHLVLPSGEKIVVVDTIKAHEQCNVLILDLPSDISLPLHLKVEAIVDTELRRATAANHSATHLLHAALRKIIGQSDPSAVIEQAGSNVDPDGLHFDFTSNKALSADQIKRVEAWVQSSILENHPVKSHEIPLSLALNSNAVSLFGEKYGAQVRVISIGEELHLHQTPEQLQPSTSQKPDRSEIHGSIELCGGTHVSSTREIFPFIITKEGSIGNGIRRIEALTSQNAVEYLQKQQQIVSQACSVLQTPAEGLADRCQTLSAKIKEQEKKISQLEIKLAEEQSENNVVTGTFIDPSSNLKLLIKLYSLPKEIKYDGAKTIANRQLSNEPNAIHLLVFGQNVLCVAHPQSTGPANLVLRSLLTAFNGKGGGDSRMAQGFFPAHPTSDLFQAIKTTISD